MRIGFYAPLKSPNHGIPSGDRKVAKLFIKVLKACGHEVQLLSELRSWECNGNENEQNIIQHNASEINKLLINDLSQKLSLDLVFVYHVYHKAPDWIGIEVAKYFNIPYVIAEVSYAPKQKYGYWKSGHEQTFKCIKRADAIIFLNQNDRQCVLPLLTMSQTILSLKPFLEDIPKLEITTDELKEKLAQDYRLDLQKTWLITIAMMRKGDKLESYRQLATAMTNQPKNNWQLIVIGDGEEFQAILDFFSPVLDKCLFLGHQQPVDIFKWLSASNLFVWPAVNEAFGLALLEAQSCGIPAIVHDYGGVSSIVDHGNTGFVIHPQSTDMFTSHITTLLQNPEQLSTMSTNAFEKTKHEHSFTKACSQIDQLIRKLKKQP